MARNVSAADGQTVQYNTIKVRLYPTPAQAELFEKTFGCCRYIWNQMLTDQQRFYNETGAHFIPTPAKYKNRAPFLKEVDNQTLIQEHNRLSQAFRVFFKNPEYFGYPNFKRKKDDKDSFTACNHEFESGPTIYTTRDGIRMTKAGIVKAVFSRRPQNGWKLRRITVEKTRTGKYYCYILYQVTVKQPETVTPTPETTVGLKYSLLHFYVNDAGDMADPPLWLRQSQEKLAKIQRQLSRMQPGSKNYEEAVQKYRLLHEHIVNQRKDFLHKESRRIANAWDAVCVRADALDEMSETLKQNRGMLNRMDYLATQSANGTYDNEVDRAALQKEVNQLKDEINRIADSANFNGIKLLDGSLDSTDKVTVNDPTFANQGKFDAYANLHSPNGPNNVEDPQLHKEASGSAKTSFEFDLNDRTITADEDGKATFTFSLTRPDSHEIAAYKEITLEGYNAGEEISAADLAAAVAKNLGTDGKVGLNFTTDLAGIAADGTVSNGKENAATDVVVEYSVKAEGSKLVFEMTDAGYKTAAANSKAVAPELMTPTP